MLIEFATRGERVKCVFTTFSGGGREQSLGVAGRRSRSEGTVAHGQVDLIQVLEKQGSQYCHYRLATK